MKTHSSYKRLSLLLLAVGLLAGLTLSARAQSVQYFLQITGIDGSSVVSYVGTNNGLATKAIDLLNYSISVENDVTIPFSTSSKAVFNGLEVFMAVDTKVYPLLLINLTSRTDLTKAVLTGWRSNGTPFKFLEITLEGPVVLKTLNTQGSSGDITYVSSSLIAGKITYTTIPQAANGTAGTAVTKSWNFAANQPN